MSNFERKREEYKEARELMKILAVSSHSSRKALDKE